MATEVLSIPEEYTMEVCEIIRAGLKALPNTTPEVRTGLEDWCHAFDGEGDGQEDEDGR